MRELVCCAGRLIGDDFKGRQFDGYRVKVSTPVCATHDDEEDNADADAA